MTDAGDRDGRVVTAVIVGAGERGSGAYGPRIHRRGQGRVVGVAEPDEGRRSAARRRFGLPEAAAFEGWDPLFAQPRFADLAIVTTGDELHVEPTLLALERGYDVLLEKPIALNLHDCERIAEAADSAGRFVAVCHLYRFSHLFRRLHDLVRADALGDVVSIQLSENVAHWHYVHSYVRGFTRNSRVPMLLQKSCHDLDLLTWLAGAPAVEVSSFMAPTRFRRDLAPEGSTERCIDGCPHRPTCPYDAVGMYADLEPMINDLAFHANPLLRVAAAGAREAWPRASTSRHAAIRDRAAWRRWPVTAVSDEGTREDVERALHTERWGRCAWKIDDHDQPAAQTVNLRFANGVLASFTMHSASHRSMRTVRIDGTKATAIGEIAGLEQRLSVTEHGSSVVQHHRLPLSFDGHGGGEAPLIADVLDAVRERRPPRTAISESIESHRIAFAAMESARSGAVVALPPSGR